MHAIAYIPSEDYSRKYVFSDCDEIIFQTEQGEHVWTTSGSGEIELPTKVIVLIRSGKYRQVLWSGAPGIATGEYRSRYRVKDRLLRYLGFEQDVGNMDSVEES